MKKKKLILTICLTVIVILSSLTLVYATNDGNSGGGQGATYHNCTGECNYIIRWSSFDIRLSLYKYDGKNLLYYGSVDYCTGDSRSGNQKPGCFNGEKAIQSTNRGGKVNYITNLGYYYDANRHNSRIPWNKNETTIVQNMNHKFADFSSSSGSWQALENDIKKYFFDIDGEIFDGVHTIDYALNKLKQEFGVGANLLSKSDLAQVYLTVEPVTRVRAGSDYYYGTAYELANYFEADEENNYAPFVLHPAGDPGNGIDRVIYRTLARSIMANYILGSDKYGFVGTSSNSLVKLVDPNKNDLEDSLSNSASKKQANVKRIKSNEGWGINVFWLGNYISTDNIEPSCTISSSGNTYTLNLQNTAGLTYDYGINGYTNGTASSTLSNFEFNKKLSYNAKSDDVKIVGAIRWGDGETKTCEVQREVPTCQSTCSGKTGDDLLACAESFCQANSTNTTEKTNCMIACPTTPPPGWNPSFSACSSSSSTNGKDTVCDGTTSGSKKTCVPASTDTYFKRECEEQSTITYGNSLPTTLLPGTGFSYTPTLSGSKTCTMTFEVEKWEWDYARSYTQSERNKLLDKLNTYNNTTANSKWAKDDKDWYTYHSEDADIKIEIETDKEGNTVTKTLVVNDTINDKGISVSSGGSRRVTKFENDTQNTIIIPSVIRTTSSNKTIYRLPAVCIAGATSGEIYSPDQDGNCKKENDGPYNDYFTDMMLSSGTYNTKVTVNKSSSNLNANDFSNTCHYNVDDDPKTPYCTISKLDDGSYKLNIFNSVEGLTYGISDKENTINNSLIFKPTSATTKIYGTLKKGDTIIDTCPAELNPPDNPGDKTTCSTLYKPTQYSEIKTYCNANWYNDTANYLSAKDCYNKCSNGDEVKNPTCKVNTEFVCDEKEKVENYCKSNYAKDGYKSEWSCINDCYCPITIPDTEICEDCDPPIPPDPGDNDDCLGITCDYIYRPISLRDPFPKNRMPGYNWIGKEVYITDDLLNPALNSAANPEYVIELTPNRIKSIKADTKRYNMGKGKNAYIDYVYKNEYNQDGKYESKFIHVNDPNSGGFYSYFTIIEGNGV